MIAKSRYLVPAMVMLMILSWVLSGCGRVSGDKPVIVVSIEPQRKIVEQLVGDRYEVKSVLSQGANPETFEPSVSQRMQMADAAFFFKTGYLPFEATLEKALSAGTPVYDMSAGIDPVHGTHSHGGGDEHAHADDVDPHVWTSVRNVVNILPGLAEALAKIDPEGSDVYSRNCKALTDSLTAIDRRIARSLNDAHAHAFAIWHPSLSYYARDYGLHQIAVGQESKEVSLGAMKEVINHARQDSVKVFFFQKEYDSRQARSINSEIGSTLVTINPLAYDWDDELIGITEALTK